MHNVHLRHTHHTTAERGNNKRKVSAQPRSTRRHKKDHHLPLPRLEGIVDLEEGGVPGKGAEQGADQVDAAEDLDAEGWERPGDARGEDAGDEAAVGKDERGKLLHGALSAGGGHLQSEVDKEEQNERADGAPHGVEPPLRRSKELLDRIVEQRPK